MSAAPATFTLDVISPEARLITRPVWQVVCPGAEGEFGVRAGHMPLLAGLQQGALIVLDTPESAPEVIQIAGGFADVTADRLTILAESVVKTA